ncbi:MAG: putative sulfate exporter family transporter [Thermomicrobiales bacterium]
MSGRSTSGFSQQVARLWPGVALCAAIAAGAWLVAMLEERLFTYAVIEAVVLALLAGMLIRTRWIPAPRFAPGIAFTAKPLLEFGIVLLGASLDLRLLQEAGGRLLLTVLITTATALGIGIWLGRKAGLTTNLAILVAVGNAICGNSAIAATAPIIRAKKEEVAAALSLTAILGVGIVIALPATKPLANLNFEQYGILAGLSVYAVPQVLAATFPVSTISGQIESARWSNWPGAAARSGGRDVRAAQSKRGGRIDRPILAATLCALVRDRVHPDRDPAHRRRDS